MLKLNILKDLLIVASINSIICLSFIQKMKRYFSCSKCIPLYSLIINGIIAVLFCISFTTVKFPISLWVGFLSYVEADTLYKQLEGKLKSFSELKNIESDEVEEIIYE